ncbi:hypothetical protein chiPu_0025140, partial [Chiloscyllium punctatum]|nr:hypothetical protein [Chiloscyllium punctatum]
ETNTTLNSLECYTCPLFGTCEQPTETVKCAGTQTWCLHSYLTFNSLAFTIKGCASETMCQNPDLLKDYGVQTQQEFYCCRESGCNRGISENSSAQTTAPSNILTANFYSSTVRNSSENMINSVMAVDNNSTEQTIAVTPSNSLSSKAKKHRK